MTLSLPCIVCDKELKNVFDDAKNQPSRGVAFFTYGQYGSTVFDETDGSQLVVNVCDDCLVAKKSNAVTKQLVIDHAVTVYSRSWEGPWKESDEPTS